ncbi:hypothetical protein [Synechococcus sp. HK01-R]|uniref:hypothetical protein n=1 Tax=Synechococcus sp. HK01-R TaxID=2751171 RepID=UPI001627F0AA|nr:hypothetical protein [Synechococcus sp. HK01-R]QNG26436.1 hypothetical protein H0O21_09190 [Synechococcus sp. HK01-R]
MQLDPFNDPREPWLTTGILISLASLFDLCKGLGVRFEGDGVYNNGSVPGRGAATVRDDPEKALRYVVDSEFFEECIQDIRDKNVELSKAVGLLQDFDGKVSTRNILSMLIWNKKEISNEIRNANIVDTISDFTFDFQEIVELAGLLKVSFRNRKSHRKLQDGTDKAFYTYHHSLMSRFKQLVDNCLKFTCSRGWITNGPVNEQGESLPMIKSHIERFEGLSVDIFDALRPPHHDASSALGAIPVSASANEQPATERENPASSTISKTDLYEIVDAIREAHDESGSYFAWLEERINSLITSAAEDLSNSLLDPWKNKNIEDVLQALLGRQAPNSDTSHGGLYVRQSADSNGGAERRFSHANSMKSDSQTSAFSQPPTAGNSSQKILSELRSLCSEMRNNLKRIDSRFEFYNCILQSPIVAPAIQEGVCSYDQLKQTDQFVSRIINTNRSFMLDEQERMYRERIDQILSKNRQPDCPF